MKKRTNLLLNVLRVGTLLALTACGMPPSSDTVDFVSGQQVSLRSKGSTKAAKCPCKADFAKQWNAVTFGCKTVLACENHGGVPFFQFEGFTEYGSASGQIICRTKGGIIDPSGQGIVDERDPSRTIDDEDEEDDDEDEYEESER